MSHPVLSHPVSRTRYAGVAAFVAIAYGVSWAVVAPLHLLGPQAPRLLGFVLSAASMFGPALAAFIVTRWVAPPAAPLRQATGLVLGRDWKRFWLLAWLAMPVFLFASIAVSTRVGVYPLDWAELSGMRALLASMAPEGTPLPGPEQLRLVVIGQVLQGMVLGPILSLPFALGEEWGWRGYLLERLLPLGRRRALVVTGIIWGLWHLPLILAGHNYPGAPAVLGVPLMVAFCVLMGVLLGWTRLATGSVWPAAIAHASLNALAPIVLALAREGAPLNLTLAGPTGLVGLALLMLPVVWVWRSKALAPDAFPPTVGDAGAPLPQRA